MKVPGVFALVVCGLIFNSTDALPPSTSTTDSYSYDSDDFSSSTLNSIAPIEFPKHNQTFVDNSTKRASDSDTEVEDLLGKNKNYTSTTNSFSVSSSATPFIAPPNPSEEDEDLAEKNDVELIEDGDADEADEIIILASQENVLIKETFEKQTPLMDGHFAAILAGAFLVFSVFGYLALLSWRRFLERKYGSREMLVNQDDFMDPDDIKHFSI